MTLFHRYNERECREIIVAFNFGKRYNPFLAIYLLADFGDLNLRLVFSSRNMDQMCFTLRLFFVYISCSMEKWKCKFRAMLLLQIDFHGPSLDFLNCE